MISHCWETPTHRMRASNKKSPTYPLHLGGVWMVGVRGYIGPKNLDYCSKQGAWCAKPPMFAIFHFNHS